MNEFDVNDYLFDGTTDAGALTDPAARIPELDQAAAHPGEPVEDRVVSNNGFAAQGIRAPGADRVTTMLCPTWVVPFTGTPELFFILPPAIPGAGPRTIPLDGPRGEIEDFALVLTYRGTSNDPSVHRAYFEDQIALVTTFLGYLTAALTPGRPPRHHLLGGP